MLRSEKAEREHFRRTARPRGRVLAGGRRVLIVVVRPGQHPARHVHHLDIVVVVCTVIADK